MGQAISRHNARRERALLLLVKGSTGNAGISLQFHNGMKTSTRSGLESVSADHDPILNSEL